MNYDITTQDGDEITFLYKEARCEHAEIAKNLGECLPAVFQYVTQNGIAMMSPPIARSRVRFRA